MDPSHSVADLLQRWREGDSSALEALVPIVYDDLRALAHRRLRAERPDHTFNTTALVHEAYLRLLDLRQIQWTDRAHFLAMASRTMRRVLVDYALRRRAAKRGGGEQPVSLTDDLPVPDRYVEEVLDLDEALTGLEAVNARAASAIEYRYFGGLTLEETAEVLGLSLATVKRELQFARAWVARALGDSFPLNR